jgi:D-glycero-alpha-D-manno-heptose 1-phosphate guanylyltransferase
MEAIILAGGFGTRLKSVVNDVPKPMADINGRPFLAYLLSALSLSGVSKAILSVGYKYDVIQNYFGDKYKNTAIVYAIEKNPLGTGGGLKQALKNVECEDALVLNGDTFFNVDLKALYGFHKQKSAVLTLALKQMHKIERYGTAVTNGDRITGFEEKAFKESGYINGGVYCLNKRISEYLDIYGDNESFSFEKDIIEKNTKSLQPFAFISDGYFIDIGIPEDYARAKMEMGALLP